MPRLRQKTAKLPASGPLARSAAFKRILVPTDFSNPSVKALKYAVRFAEQSGATIHLLYVVEHPTFIYDIETFPLAISEAEQIARAKHKLLRLADAEIEELVPVKTDVRTGKPFRAIAELARKTNADLIIIATHGRTGLSRMLLGSTTELLVRHAPCPVLVVRDREREFV
jgi:nucleotide-binding universal stress UspA family protein